MAPFLGEEFGNRIAIASPLILIHSGNCHKFFIGRRETVICPIIEDEKNVGAMLNCRQVSGLGEIIANVKRHPCFSHWPRHWAARVPNRARKFAGKPRDEGNGAYPAVPAKVKFARLARGFQATSWDCEPDNSAKTYPASLIE